MPCGGTESHVGRLDGVEGMVGNAWLSSQVTVAKYHRLERNQDRDGIARFIYERFSERYVEPLRCAPREKRHGFCTMAISCLMIEALESFWNGWPHTKTCSKKAFGSFFRRCAEEDSDLGVFANHADDFFSSVRCSILHQAETTNGWRIHRKGDLFDPATRTINATKFHKKMGEALQRYCRTLKGSDWNSEVWVNLRRKMRALIENCRPRAE